MKTNARKSSGTGGEKRQGAPESPASNETFPRRTAKPGAAGLANEARPGLGTRGNEPFPGEPPMTDTSAEPEHAVSPGGEGNVAQRQRSSREPNDKPIPHEPQEQNPDSWAQKQERATGVSGHAGNT